MSVFIGYPSFMAYQMMKGKKGNNDGFPVLPGDVTRWHFGGLTNEMMAAMDDPRLEDADGKGRFLSFKNFLWAGMSGVGGYVTSKEVYEYDLNTYSHTFIEYGSKVHDFYVVFELTGYDESFKYGFKLDVRSTTQGLKKRVTYTKNGIYTFQYKDEEGLDNLFLIGYNGVGGEKSTFTVKIFPLYPGAIVFDGVDDYGICENFPILTKEKGYTVVALRQYLEGSSVVHGLISNTKNWFTNGAFVVEYYSKNNNYLNNPVSFGAIGSTLPSPNIFTYQTSTKYNGTQIKTGNFEATDLLIVGGARLNGYNANVAIWEIVILDHDATEEELQKIQNYYKQEYPWLFPDQAWTVSGKTNEDTDRATIANITGNGNNFVLSNFGFAEGSGYGLYGQNYISYVITNRAVYTKTNSSIHVTKSITAGVNFIESARDVTIPSYRIKVTGIQSGQEMIYRGRNNTFLTNIPSDGIYVLPAVENGSDLGFQFVSYTGDCDITIEQIPEYEGYLITDGVDDEIISAKLIQFADKFTIVGDWKFMEDRNDNAGLLKANQIYIYNATTGMRIYLKQGLKNYPFSCKKINALTSDGWVYDEKWDKYKVYPIGSDIDISSRLFLGFYSSNFTKIALKNLGIYNDQLLSKDDCIKPTTTSKP